MALSKKHFIRIAAEIKAELDKANSLIPDSKAAQVEIDGRTAALGNLACSLAKYFREENELFDGQRFIRACGF